MFTPMGRSLVNVAVCTELRTPIVWLAKVNSAGERTASGATLATNASTDPLKVLWTESEVSQNQAKMFGQRRRQSRYH